jgi:hypothetical protein
MRLIGWTTLLGFVGAANGLGGAADQARAQVKCDNKCRMKMSHYYTPSGPCVRFATQICLLCDPAFNVLCAGPAIAGGCNGPFKDTFVTYHDDCPLVCQPAGGAWAVEATDLGIGSNPQPMPIYACEGIIVDSEPPIEQ